jgi:hypothetical protein
VSNPAPAIHLTWGCWRRSRFKESSYEEADRLPELHEDDVEWLATMRPVVHELKSRILADLRKALSSGTAGKLWQRVIAGVADRLDVDQINRLLRLDRKYQGYSASTDGAGEGFIPVMPGGFSAIIEVAGHVEKELELGTLHRTREALEELVVPDLIGRPRLRGADQRDPYFVLAAGDGGDKWRAALDVYTEAEAGETAFWADFRSRLGQSLASEIPKVLTNRVKPEHAQGERIKFGHAAGVKCEQSLRQPLFLGLRHA